MDKITWLTWIYFLGLLFMMAWGVTAICKAIGTAADSILLKLDEVKKAIRDTRS